MKGTTVITPSKKILYLKEIVKNLPSVISKRLPGEIAVIIVSPQESLKLNSRYRNSRKPANVLSFLYGQEYGEIIVCEAVIYKDAKKQGNTKVFQMTWMVLHGMLHLAGLHHEKSKTVDARVAYIEHAVLSKIFSVPSKK